MPFGLLQAVSAALRSLPSRQMLIALILLPCLVRSQLAAADRHQLHFSMDDDAMAEEEEHLDRLKRQAWGTQNLWKDLGLPQFWNQYKDGPYGIVIRGWQYAKCGKSIISVQLSLRRLFRVETSIRSFFQRPKPGLTTRST